MTTKATARGADPGGKLRRRGVRGTVDLVCRHYGERTTRPIQVQDSGRRAMDKSGHQVVARHTRNRPALSECSDKPHACRSRQRVSHCSPVGCTSILPSHLAGAGACGQPLRHTTPGVGLDRPAVKPRRRLNPIPSVRSTRRNGIRCRSAASGGCSWQMAGCMPSNGQEGVKLQSAASSAARFTCKKSFLPSITPAHRCRPKFTPPCRDAAGGMGHSRASDGTQGALQ